MIDSYMRYGALAAKAKALYGKRLRFSDFEHMAGLPNEQSILDYLRGQAGWSAAVSAALSAMNSSGYVGRMELEDALRLQIWREYEGLNHFIPRPDKNLVHFPCGRQSCLPFWPRCAALSPTGGSGTASSLCQPALQGKSESPHRPVRTTTDFSLQSRAASTTSLCSTSGPTLRMCCPITPPRRRSSAPPISPASTASSINLLHRRDQVAAAAGHGPSGWICSTSSTFSGSRPTSPVTTSTTRLSSHELQAQTGENQGHGATLPASLRYSQYCRILLIAGRFTAQDVASVEDCYRRSFYTFNKRQLVSGAPSIYTAVSYLNVKSTELKALVNVIESVKYGAHYDEDFARLVGE